jgi:hypothetical protein
MTHGDCTGDQGSTGSISSSGDLTRVTQILLATRPWIRFFSVLGFVGCGLFVVAALAFATMGFVSEELGVGGPFIAFAYLGMAVLYLFPSLHLHRCANALRDLAANRSGESFEAALSHQRKFWRFMGVATVVGLGVYAVGLIVAAVVAALAA